MREELIVVRIKNKEQVLHAIFLDHIGENSEACAVIRQKELAPLSEGILAKLRRYKFRFTLVAPEPVQENRLAALVQLNRQVPQLRYFNADCRWNKNVAFGALEMH